MKATATVFVAALMASIASAAAIPAKEARWVNYITYDGKIY